MHHPTDRITHTTAFITPVVEHWLEREIAQWVPPHEGSIPRPIAPWANAPPLSYVPLPSHGMHTWLTSSHSDWQRLVMWTWLMFQLAGPAKKSPTWVEMNVWELRVRWWNHRAMFGTLLLLKMRYATSKLLVCWKSHHLTWHCYGNGMCTGSIMFER